MRNPGMIVIVGVVVTGIVMGLAVGGQAAVSGDPTSEAMGAVVPTGGIPPAPDWCNPATPVYSIPTYLTRQGDGSLTYSICRLSDPTLYHCHGVGCETCPQWPATQSIPLAKWCEIVDGLVAPPATGPGQPAKFDGVAFCKSICVP